MCGVSDISLAPAAVVGEEERRIQSHSGETKDALPQPFNQRESGWR